MLITQLALGGIKRASNVANESIVQKSGNRVFCDNEAATRI
jgi:hypothetical protein